MALSRKAVILFHCRCYTSIPNSRAVRDIFLNYFVNDNNHKFVRSSPVVPYCDPTVPFVNAGMNQFKKIFLGEVAPVYLKVANSQKCIRVGGKHNDLDVVGSDGYHHTFFEMLGNWSFGDYFKRDACKLAWQLLTGPYGISKDRLYVTYFCGSEELGLEADIETYETWRHLGVPASKILPFGATDNFWEMDSVGPCGPCTEIHIDHIPGRNNAQNLVNKGFADMTELWNLVFIQYNRKLDGSLEKLPTHHVDTGMGFERLVAVLQNKRSNYDTDIFQPLFCAIQKISGAPAYRGFFGSDDSSGIDTAYRILADHCRMATVAIADGVFPHHNLRLRRVIRKAIHVGEKYFLGRKYLLNELTNYVSEMFSETYPEISEHLEQVQLIIKNEEQLLTDLEKNVAMEWKKVTEDRPHLRHLDVTEMPGLVLGYQELQTTLENMKRNHDLNLGDKPFLEGSLVFKLYDTYGLDERHIKELAAAEGLNVDFNSFHLCMDNAKLRSKQIFKLLPGNELYFNITTRLKENGIAITEDHFKYVYSKTNNAYVFPDLQSTVQAIIVDGKSAERTVPGTEAKIILSRSNFYHEAGGQESDTGHIILQNGSKILVNDVTNHQGYILHSVTLDKNNGAEICVGDMITLSIDSDRRLANMRNHTATHLINAALRRILTVTCQNSSRVTSKDLVFDFSVYGEEFGIKQVLALEQVIGELVASRLPVNRRTISGAELLALEKTVLVPGEVYPEEGIHLIEVESKEGIVSREPCCGTHVLNTADLGAVSVLSVQSSGTGSRSLRAVTGPTAVSIFENGIQLEKEVSYLVESPQEQLQSRFQIVKQKLKSNAHSHVPYVTYRKCAEILENVATKIKQQARGELMEQVKIEMQDVIKTLECKQSFIVHFLQCSSFTEDTPLQKATRLCPNTPILLLARSEGAIKARCCVPEVVASETFNAQLWMESVLKALKAQGFAPRGQNPLFVYNMKGKSIPINKQDVAISNAVAAATEFANHALGNRNQCANK